MKVGDVLNYIEEIAPSKTAEKWDNVGLMLGSREQQVKKLFITLDVTEAAIEQALSAGADLIVSHHPFLFTKLSTLDFDTPKGRLIHRLIMNNISAISAHTNLDIAQGGVNDTLADMIGLVETVYLKKYYAWDCPGDYGFGKIGFLKPEVKGSELLIKIKNVLKVDNVRIIGALPETVNKAAVFCGSFDVDLNLIKEKNIDVLITGDIKYHTALDAREMGLCIIDVGHFGSERIIVDKLKNVLSERFKDIEIVCNNMETDPFIFA